jgi:acetyl esterase
MKLGLASRLRVRMLQPVAHVALRTNWVRRKLLARKTSQIAQGLDEDLAIMWAINDATGQGHFWKHGANKARQRMQESILLINPARAEFAHIVATELTVQGASGPLRARSYAAPSTRGAAPTIVFFHGGGWVVGDLDTHDELCRHFAARGAVRVIAVDYRCAPEHVFPAAAHDAIAAFRNIAANAAAHQADPKRLAVCGDSAGGNLSAVVANATRDDAIAPALQVLLYPALDAERTAPSHTSHGKGFGLDEDSIGWYLGNYIGTTVAAAAPGTPAASLQRDPLLSPAHAADALLRGVAPAIVEIAGFDPLRDEARAYVQRLRDLGVAVEENLHANMVHGYCLMTDACASAWKLTDAMCTRVVQRLHACAATDK